MNVDVCDIFMFCSNTTGLKGCAGDAVNWFLERVDEVAVSVPSHAWDSSVRFVSIKWRDIMVSAWRLEPSDLVSNTTILIRGVASPCACPP